jgi:O-antigen/teichoic acid export membrane protein
MRLLGLDGSGPDKLVRNSAFLILASGITALLGFLFWVVVARLFSPAAVGIATSLVSATSLIGYLSLLGLNSVLLRFPNSPLRNTEVTQSILLTAVTACVVSVIYLAAIPLISGELTFIRGKPLFCIGFSVFSVFGAVNMLTDAVFVARRIPHYNAIVDGLIQGITKLVLPVVLAGFGAAGILASVGWGYIVAAVASVILLYRVSDFRLTLRPMRTPLLGRVGFSFASYVSSVLNLGPVMLLPILTLHLLGAEANAYYYLAFQIANLLNAASYAIGESLMAEASTDESRLGPLLRRSGLMLSAILVPAVTVVAGASGLLLRAFGQAYATEARNLLILLSLSAFAVGLNTWASVALKFLRRMGHLIASNAIYLVITIGLVEAFGRHGVLAIGWAWFIGNTASGVYAAVVLLVSRVRRPAGRHRCTTKGSSYLVTRSPSPVGQSAA